jgi:hypothetical protein
MGVVISTKDGLVKWQQYLPGLFFLWCAPGPKEPRQLTPIVPPAVIVRAQ